MTNYEYDGIPEMTLPALPKAVQPAALEFILNFLQRETPQSMEVSGAHIYDRKGYYSSDRLGGRRNGSYGYDSDDVVLSFSIRIQSHQAEELVKASRVAISEEARLAAEAEASDLDRQLAEMQSRRGALRSDFGV